MSDRFERFSLAISEIWRHWHRIAGAEMDRYGLKGAHAVYLTALTARPEGVTAGQLAELCGKDKSDVSRMVGLLEKKGMVRKVSEYQNGYGGALLLTDKGREAAAFVQQRAALAVSLAGNDLDDGDREVMYACLEHIADRLRNLSERGLPEE